MTGGKSEQEALLVEARVRERLFKGLDPSPEERQPARITVGELIDLFYQSPRFLVATEQWREVVQGQLENVIRPELGSSPYVSLTKDRVFKVYLNLKEMGRSNSTIRKYHYKLSILGELFTELYPHEESPLPKILGKIRDFDRLFPKEPPTRNIDALTDQEIVLVLQELEKSRSKLILPFVKLLAYTGLRRSEGLNLKWSDIDFASGFLHVRKSKNGSARAVPLEKGALEALQPLPRSGEYLFTTEKGERYHKDSFLRPLQRAVKRAGINKRVDLHTLRHSYGSNKIRGGWGLKKVSMILGHSDIQITADVYTHLQDGDLKVRDEFRFDNGSRTENSGKLEGVSQDMVAAVTQFIHTIHQVSGEELTSPSLTQNVSCMIQQVLQSNAQKPQDSAKTLKTPSHAPLMLRRAKKERINDSFTRSDQSKISLHFNHFNQNLKWRTRVESNHRPSAPEADALSN